MVSDDRKAQIRAWQKANPEKLKAAKKKYYASEKGKLQKRKEEAAFKESGGRLIVERRRASKPLSQARKIAKLKYQLARRGSEKTLSELDAFALSEAIFLAKLREKMLGTKWHVDHIIPVSKGGSSSYDNIQVVPAMWNRKKSNKHSDLYFSRK